MSYTNDTIEKSNLSGIRRLWQRAAGCEMAQALNRLGAKVIVVARSILPKEDPQCAEVIAEVFEAEGIQVTGSNLTVSEEHKICNF